MRTLPGISTLTILLLFLLVLPASAGYIWENTDIPGTGDVGWYTSLAFGADGNPAISYYDQANGDLKYAWKYFGGWDTTTVDAAGDVGLYTSLAVGADGNPVISYYDATNDDLKCAWKDVGGWHTATVDAAGDVGLYTSLAVGADGNPAISYYDATNDDLKCAWKDVGGWHTATVDPGSFDGWYYSDVGQYTSLAFDKQGNPAISYYDDTQYSLKYAWKDAGGWQNVTVDNSGWVVGTYTSLAFDADGYPAISYHDSHTNYDLKYAWKDAGGWHNVTVHAAGDVGLCTSLGFDADGNPAISYYDATNGYLKYAWEDAGVWHTATVDAAGDVGRYTSLAFDTDGNPAISYYYSGTYYRCPKFASGTPAGTISVSSIPMGAAIWLDGVGTGRTTPADLEDVPIGMHNVTVTYPGYLPCINDAVQVVFDETTYVSFTLLRPGYISVSSDPDTAWIWLDGVNTTEQTDATLTGIAPGTHNVTVQKSLYQTPANQIATVTSDATASVTFTLDPLPPDANFTATPLSGEAPLAVQFTDLSSGIVNAWSWDFGDGATSAVQNPAHTYAAGTYTVTLTVENSAGDDTITKTGYITAIEYVHPSGGGNSRFAFNDGTGTVLTSSGGKILHTTTITSGDGIATLTLPQGTVALGGDGKPVTEITIEKVIASDLPPVPDGATFSFAGSAYECSPAGASFAPAITLAFTLTEDEWEAWGGDFSVRFYDDATGTWVEVPVTIDAATHTVTATVSHFSIFALFVEAAEGAAPAAETTLAPAATTAAEETAEPTSTPESPLVFAPVAALGGMLLLLRRRS